MSRLTRGEIETLIDDLIVAHPIYTPQLRTLREQSLSQEAVRDEALENVLGIAGMLEFQAKLALGHGESDIKLDAKVIVPKIVESLRALKLEPNAAGWNEKGIADIGVLPGEVDATAGPAPAAPDAPLVSASDWDRPTATKILASTGEPFPIYRVEDEIRASCPDPQECKRANRCLNEPPCWKFAAMTGASDD